MYIRRLCLCASYLSIAMFLPLVILCCLTSPVLHTPSPMAFAKASSTVHCDCFKAPSTFFLRLNASWRPGHEWYDEVRGRPERWRVCNVCELSFREEEWEQKGDEEKAKLGEDWPTQDRIARDRKIANKGQLCPLKGKCLFEAKRKLAEERERANTT